MAQEELGQVPNLDLREVEEIERLLKEEEERAEEKILSTHPLKRFLNRKLFLGLAAAILLVWGAGWGLLSLMEKRPEVSSVSTMKQAPAQDLISSTLQIQKPNIYPLEPFFVPILSKNKETGKFLHVTAHLVLSNHRLRKDVDKIRPLIRQSMYTVISRKKFKDFEKMGVKIEERIKKETLTASNSFLLSGTGTITDIIFTEFIINPS